MSKRRFNMDFDGVISMTPPHSSVPAVIHTPGDPIQKVHETIEMAYRAGRRDVVNELKDQLDVINN